MKTNTVKFDAAKKASKKSEIIPHAGKVEFRTTCEPFNVCTDCGEVLNPFDKTCACGSELKYMEA